MRVKDIVLRLEETIGLHGPPLRVRNAVEIQLSEHFGVSALAAAEQAERLEAGVIKEISAIHAKANEQKTTPALVIVGSDFNIVAGSCYVFSTDSPKLAQAKSNRLLVEPIYDAIKALSFSDFERFCARVLYQLGAQTVRVTRRSNDQGIDFYGTLNLGKFADLPEHFFRLAHDVEIKFAGQAKHYANNPLSTAIVRELVGSITLARLKVFSTENDPFEDFDLKPFDPLVPMLFSTGRLTSGARQLATKTGVIGYSGEQLAAFLADEGVGLVTEAAETRFCQDTFSTWLNG